MSIKIEIEVSEENEGNRAPYWMVFDRSEKVDVNNFYSKINGPFFSYEDAENHIKNRELNDENTDTIVIVCPCAPLGCQYSNKLAEKGFF